MQQNEQSPLQVDQVKDVKKVEYTKEETLYYGNLMKRLKRAQELRDQEHDEFDGMTLVQFVENNKKGANTYIAPKKNKEDTNFVTGTIRQKMFTYLAAINNLDLNPDVQAFDKDDNEIVLLGESMEDILFRVGELDNDEEKKLMRQYSLLEQGTVFVQESWEERWRKKKSFKGKYNGKVSGKKVPKWKVMLKKAFSKCTRNLLMMQNVYLGDIHQFDTDKQPFIFTVELRSYDEAKSIYGKWDRWENVPRKIDRELLDDEGVDSLYSAMKLTNDNLKDQVAIIKYQDKWNDEYMTLINGVMMHPVGYPLSAESPTGEYTIEKQILEPISPFFAYGKSIPARMKTAAALLDEMYRMAILKTQKSFAPPMFNNTGTVLSSRIFVPGKITMGIDGERLTKVDPEARGVQSSEYNMLEMLQRNIDTNTTDPTYSGQQPQGTPTATQILEVQKQAKMMIGLTVFACAQLEKKIAWLRIFNLLEHWFNKVENEYDKSTGQFTERYRTVSRSKMIEGEGNGQQITKVVPPGELPTPKEVYEEEEELSEPGSPVRITYIDADEIKRSKYHWAVSVVPRERKTDPLNKVLFDEMMQKVMAFPNVNMEHLSERFAEVWEENPSKMFNIGEEAPAEEEEEMPPEEGGGMGEPQPGVPQAPGPAQQLGGLNG